MNDTDDKLTEAWRTPQSDTRAEAKNKPGFNARTDLVQEMRAADPATPSFSARTEQMREMLRELKERGDENAAMILRLQGAAEKIVATLDAIGVTLAQVQRQLADMNIQNSG